jgi:hypothetical protein
MSRAHKWKEQERGANQIADVAGVGSGQLVVAAVRVPVRTSAGAVIERKISILQNNWLLQLKSMNK